ncbi:MAG: hypothetical protein H6607_07645 [Flavobacteriales bacterium]|nr:hypothetical protein [Flavobacteriales bacterium]
MIFRVVLSFFLIGFFTEKTFAQYELKTNVTKTYSVLLEKPVNKKPLGFEAGIRFKPESLGIIDIEKSQLWFSAKFYENRKRKVLDQLRIKQQGRYLAPIMELSIYREREKYDYNMSAIGLGMVGGYKTILARHLVLEGNIGLVANANRNFYRDVARSKNPHYFEIQIGLVVGFRKGSKQLSDIFPKKKD